MDGKTGRDAEPLAFQMNAEQRLGEDRVSTEEGAGDGSPAGSITFRGGGLSPA